MERRGNKFGNPQERVSFDLQQKKQMFDLVQWWNTKRTI